MKLKWLAAAIMSLFLSSATAYAAHNPNADITGPLDSSNGTSVLADFFTATATVYKLTISWSGLGVSGPNWWGSFGAVVMDGRDPSAGGTLEEVGNLFKTMTASASGTASVTLTGLNIGQDYLLYGFASTVPGAHIGVSSFTATATAVQAVAGPEAGAGLGALALGGMALYLKRRRKCEDAAT